MAHNEAGGNLSLLPVIVSFPPRSLPLVTLHGRAQLLPAGVLRRRQVRPVHRGRHRHLRRRGRQPQPLGTLAHQVDSRQGLGLRLGTRLQTTLGHGRGQDLGRHGNGAAGQETAPPGQLQRNGTTGGAPDAAAGLAGSLRFGGTGSDAICDRRQSRRFASLRVSRDRFFEVAVFNLRRV